jgi:hypothetical protein
MIKKVLNTLIILSFVFVINKSYQHYNCLKNMCFFIVGSPPKNFVLYSLITYTGIMMVLPIMLLLIRYYVIKRSSIIKK